MYDQLAGGFARYSVDARWVVPHFEKMLYDNALLLRASTPISPACRDRRSRSPGASPRRPPPSCCATCARPRAGSPRRSTPTPRGRGPDLRLDARAARRGARRRRRRLGGDAVRRHPAGDLRARQLDAAAAGRPGRPGALGRVRAALLAAREPRVRSRPATTRSSPPGTAWPCSRSPRPVPRWAATSGSPPPTQAGGSAAGAARRRRPRCAGRRATASSGPRPGCWTTTRSSPRRCSRCTRPPVTATRLDQAVRAAGPRPGPVRRRRPAASSTPPTTPRPCCTGPRDLTDNATPERGGRAAGALLTASVLVDDPQRYREAAEEALRSAGTLARAVPAFRRALADGGGGRGARAPAGRGGRPGAGPGGAGRARARRSRPAARWSWPAPRTLRACRCWRIARWSTAPPRRTSAAGSSATAPSRPRRS